VPTHRFTPSHPHSFYRIQYSTLRVNFRSLGTQFFSTGPHFLYFMHYYGIFYFYSTFIFSLLFVIVEVFFSTWLWGTGVTHSTPHNHFNPLAGSLKFTIRQGQETSVHQNSLALFQMQSSGPQLILIFGKHCRQVG